MKIQRKLRQQRVREGEELWKKIEDGSFSGKLSRDQASSVLLYKGVKNPYVFLSDIIKRKNKKISFELISGVAHFDSKDIFRHIVEFVQPRLPDLNSVRDAVEFSVRLPRTTLDLYAKIARKKNLSVRVLVTNMLNEKAKDVESRIQADLLAYRQKLLDQIDIEI